MLKLLLLGLLVLVVLLAVWSRVGAAMVERRYPPLGAFIEVDGVRLHYLMAGEGPAMVLLHGANSNLRDFSSSILPQLAKRYRVIAFDRPGLGYSQRPRGDWPTPARTAQLMLDAAAKLGAEQPLLVGHSWAGSIVMAALVEMPERIAGGALIGGVAGHWAGPVDWTYELGGIPVLGRLFAHTLVYPAGIFVLEGAVRGVLAPNPVPQDYVHKIGAPLALRPHNFLHNVQDMNHLSEYLQSLSARYDRISKPLLLIHGDRDELVPFWNHGRRLLPVVPDVTAVKLPDTGHAPHHSNPGAVIGALSDFLDRIRPAP
jgi:pimeloyl-ACP methyl ester carboxylesterase